MVSKNTPNQKEVWNHIAAAWQENRKSEFPGVSEFLKAKTGNILDLGCGSGRNFKCIPKNSLLYAVDFSEEMIKFAKKEAEKLKLQADLSVCDAQKLPFKDNTFDAAVFSAALHCIESEKERKKALQELFRVLKPGAEAFISVWSKNQARINGKTKDQLIPWTAKVIKVLRYYYIFDKDEFSSLLKSVGFKVLSLKEDDNIVAIVKKK